MSIGEKIYNLRIKANISQEAMGLDLGVSRQAVSKWETNQSTPDLENLKMIANYFNIPLTDLIDESVDKLIVKPDSSIDKKLIKAHNVLFIISISVSALLFTCFILIVLLQKPLVKLLNLSVFEEQVFVFPAFEFLGLSLLIAFIIALSLKVLLKNNSQSKSIGFQIASIVLCAVIINTYLSLPSWTNIIFNDLLKNAEYAIAYSSLRYLLSYIQPYMIIVGVTFVTAMSLSLAVKAYKNK